MKDIKILHFLLLIFAQQLLFAKTLNIVNYGAVGDGITDNTIVIQKAIDDLKFGDELYIPTGEFIIRNTLMFNKNNVKVYGNGDSSTLICDYPKYSSIKSLMYTFFLEEASNVIFDSFSVDGGAKVFEDTVVDDYGKEVWDVYGAYNIFFIKSKYDDAVHKVTIKNMNLKNSYFSAIHTYGRLNDPNPKFSTSEILIENSKFSNIGIHGVGFNFTNNSKIIGNLFRNVGKAKMISGFGSGLGVDISAGSNHIIVQNNIVDGAGAGMKAETHRVTGEIINSTNIIFKNNEIKNLYKGDLYKSFYGIKLNGINCSAIGNNIESYEHGILIGIDAKNNLVSQNKIWKTEAKDAAGIRIDKNLGNHEIVNNLIFNSGAQGLLISNVSNIIISNNIIGKSNSENIRILGGNKITITSNYLFDAQSYNISLIPLKKLSIANVKLEGNIYFSLENKEEEKGIFLLEGLRNIISKNNKYITKMRSVNRAHDLDVDDIVINDKFHFNNKQPLVLKVIIKNGKKVFQTVKYLD